jgi:hypothetical protein
MPVVLEYLLPFVSSLITFSLVFTYLQEMFSLYNYNQAINAEIDMALEVNEEVSEIVVADVM